MVMGGVVFSVVLTVHVLAGLSVIGLVLMQHGKGADMGAAFGSGASGSLFGSSGSANFLSRTTGVLAAVFFVTSLTLSYLASSGRAPATKSVMDGTAPVSAPASDLPPAPVAPSDDGSKAKDIPR
jgi:preprotein translocase subunit SecG